ncbi:hypothetical protein [Nonomuraea dietziae]|uniref:hypothetical protein n=1 Tax=Nonomuraea dietziae TaxID=65515 RepID=UPI0033C91378
MTPFSAPTGEDFTLPPASLEDRILAALADVDVPMAVEDVLEVVNADGGREVSLGGVRNVLTRLAKSGKVAHPGRNQYAPAN